MFGQVNSEHCRHKIFNAHVAGGRRPAGAVALPDDQAHACRASGRHARGLQGQRGCDRGMLRADIRSGSIDKALWLLHGTDRPDHEGRKRTTIPRQFRPHPAPRPASAARSATRPPPARAAKPRRDSAASWSPTCASPGYLQPWEREYAQFPCRLASPLAIMLDGPTGGAGFGNEFGRPQLSGFFRTYEEIAAGHYRGYHKPIMPGRRQWEASAAARCTRRT